MTECLALGTSTLDRLDAGRIATPAYARRYDKRICHLGVGRFHRAHLADYLHRLLQSGHADGWGLCAIGLRIADRPVIEALRKQDGLYSLWETDGGEPRGRIIGSIMDAADASEDPTVAIGLLADAVTRIVSLTVTEAGYCLDAHGELDPTHADIAHDLTHPQRPRSVPGLIVHALSERQRLQRGGLTLLSCDNLIGNGHKLRSAIMGYADRVDPALPAWISQHVRFPCSMVDRITPAADPSREQALCTHAGIRDGIPVLSEDWQQWIVEDDFARERPDFSQAGAIWSQQVEAYEDLKVGLLNGGHSALSHVGLMLGYQRVDQAATDPLIRRWLRAYMQDVAAVLNPPDGVDVSAYCESLLQRFSNTAIEDRLLRLAQDSSTKFQQVLMPPLQRRLERGLTAGMPALAIALWLQYLATVAGETDTRYLDVNKAQLLPLATAAVAQRDAQAFVAAILPLPAPRHAQFAESVSRHLQGLLQQGSPPYLQATLAAR